MDAELRARIDGFMDAGDDERRAIADAIVEASDETLSLARIDRTAVFLHRPSGMLMNLVPGGTFLMGLATEERERLRQQYMYWDDCDEVEFHFARVEIGVLREVTIAPFLLAARPMSGTKLGGDRALPDLKKVAKLPAPKYIDFLTAFDAGTFGSSDVEEVERTLAEVGLRLPSEAEHEWAARAGTDNLFPHGNEIPKSPNIGENPFGFVDLGADAEVCADGWVATMNGIPNDGSPRAPGPDRVVRGGAASCYPWQGCGEWMLLLNGWRSAASGNDGFLVARPAMSL